jgi:glycosyltransferase involved in cell wall biosynthesis
MGLGTRVIAVSEAVRASMQKRGIRPSKLTVVLNGTIGSARFEGQDRTPATLGSPSILFVGGMHPRKGLPDLFGAFRLVYAKHPEAHLYLIGEGPFAATYRDMVAAMECAGAVSFLGSKEDPFPWMSGADIFVLPSHADPAPLVLSEAREARCAVIGTSVDGVPQLLEHGEAGILVPPRDPSALARALGALLDSPDLIEQWKARSQTRIERLSIERVARETLAVYRDAGVRG